MNLIFQFGCFVGWNSHEEGFVCGMACATLKRKAQPEFDGETFDAKYWSEHKHDSTFSE